MIIKKSGKKQKFDSRKIRRCINKACVSARLSRKKVKKVEEEALQTIHEILEKREMTTAEIRDIVLHHLELLDPAVVRAWITYEMLRLQRKKY